VKASGWPGGVSRTPPGQVFSRGELRSKLVTVARERYQAIIAGTAAGACLR
jgi:hypothetical protein